MMKSQVLGVFAVCFAIAPPAQPGTVSATPGSFSGTIVYNGPAAPDSVSIDARDVTNTFTAHADATQGQPECPSGSATRCYKITVESGLASSYWLRPIALVSKSSPLYGPQTHSVSCAGARGQFLSPISRDLATTTPIRAWPCSW
jgi:hypothetical protein